ncbi:MAG: AGE family epimerase/isomerase [Bacteroidales bacterium]|nr:AGE family epimerase/isomerase [Bacteroidales bacterium]
MVEITTNSAHIEKNFKFTKINTGIRLLLICISVLFSISITKAQYVVKSPNILNPDLNIEYVKKNMAFWARNSYDPLYGGFFSSVGQTGNLLNTDQKSLIVQTRHGYGFTRAFMLTGDEIYLDYAKSALDFLFKYGWDSTNGGWYCFANRDGSIDNDRAWNPNTKKWGFQQQYALLGIVANYEATRNSEVKKWMDKGVNSLYTNMWDTRSGFEGYYEDASLTWGSKTGKGFACTVDAISTNTETCFLVTREEKFQTRLTQLADIIINRFIPEMSNPLCKVTYPSIFSSDWIPDYSTKNSTSSVGHFLKTAWCLGRVYLCNTSKTEYRDAAIKILDQTWSYQKGAYSLWDHRNGGPFFSVNILTGEGTKDYNNKDYWMLEQGFTGPMLNYHITKNPIYLQMADESLGFFMTHQVDSVYGEIFSQVDSTGTLIKNGVKGDDFKASYHSTEMGYFAYLYSNLFYLKQPVNLYYKFEPTDSIQHIRLSPLSVEDEYLKIKYVTLDGIQYTQFDSDSRVITVEPNQSGKFKVTFELNDASANAIQSLQKEKIKVYPNPTKGDLTITGLMNCKAITIIDVNSKVLFEQTINNQESIQLDLQNQKPGVLFLSITDGFGHKIVKKIIKL